MLRPFCLGMVYQAGAGVFRRGRVCRVLSSPAPVPVRAGEGATLQAGAASTEMVYGDRFVSMVRYVVAGLLPVFDADGMAVSDSELRGGLQMSDNESGLGGFGWFLAGLGFGALVGVLYAPKAGRDTRDDLLAASLEAKDKAAALAQQGRDKAADLAEQGKQQVDQYVDKGREYYDKGKTQWSQYVDKGKDALQDQSEKLQSAVEAGKETYADVAKKA